TQKSILERKAPPTFDVVVEIQSWTRVAVHEDVAATVDAKLRGFDAPPELRHLQEDGEIDIVEESIPIGRRYDRDDDEGETYAPRAAGRPPRGGESHRVRLLPYSVSRGRIEQAIHHPAAPVDMVDDIREADAVITLRH